MIDVEKHNINTGNLTDCADIMISDNVTGGLIATAIDADDSMDCADNAAGGLTTSIDYGGLTDCADIMISNDAADGFIATDIYADDSTDSADDVVGGFTADIDAVDFTDCADIFISDNVADELIATGAGYSTDCADDNILGDAVDGFIISMG